MAGSNRLKQAKADCERAIDLCLRSDSAFKEFELESASEDDGVGLQFIAETQGKRFSFSIQTTQDYPHGTALINGENSDIELVEGLTIGQILQKIATQLNLPRVDEEISNDQNCSNKETSLSNKQPISAVTKEHVDELEKDDFGSVQSPQISNRKWNFPLEICPELQTDLENFREVGGSDSMDWRYLNNLYTIDIQIKIYYHHSIIEHRTAEAWGIKLDEPLVLMIEEIDPVHYRKSQNYPTQKQLSLYYQSKKGEDFFVRKQLHRIVCEFLKRNWIAKHANVQENLWIELRNHILQRLPTLNAYCVVCDKQQVCTDLFFPSVCEDPLCIFGYETLGVTDYSLLKFRSEKDMKVVDLLMAMMRRAAFSSRRDVIVTPFPSIVDPNDAGTLALSPVKKDFTKLNEVIRNLPCPTAMRLLAEETDIRKKMNEIFGQLAFPLIRWILTSNRSYLVPLETNERLSFMATPHQFLMLLDSPAKEAKFKAAKQASGENGSPSENWHSILRQGLINASGTALQRHGAAYGNGIYLSPLLGVSWPYTSGHRPESWDRPCAYKSMNRTHRCNGFGSYCFGGSSCSFIAICEVIETAELRLDITGLKNKLGAIWVASNPAHVCTRMLFAYDAKYQPDVSIDLRRKEFLNAIERTLDEKRLCQIPMSTPIHYC